MYLRNRQEYRKLKHLSYEARRSGRVVHTDIFIFRLHSENNRSWDWTHLPHDSLQNTVDTRGKHGATTKVNNSTPR